MIKIITIAWCDSKVFEKHNCSLRHNAETLVPKSKGLDAALDVAFKQATEIIKSGLNVMIRNFPDKNIIWVAADDKSFSVR